MSDIARLILEQGRIAAQARERSGALWGNAISDISRVPGQVMNAYQQRQDRQQALALAANREARDTAGAADEHQVRVAQLESMRQKQAADWAEKLRVSNADVPTIHSEIDAMIGKLWTPEEATALKQAAATPEGAQRIITRLAPVREPKPAEPFTLSPGQQRFGPDGQPIANVPAPAARPVAVGPGSTLISPETNQPVFTAPEKPPAAPAVGSLADYLTRAAKEKGKKPEDLTTAEVNSITKQHTEATQRAPVLGGMNALYADIDPKAIAAQIRAGQHPPDISQYGRPAAAAVASELAKKGPNGEAPFNLSAAQREWKAQVNLNRTMNGSQQVRLDESIRSGLAMYDKIDDLASQWDGKGLGPLSRVNLAAARQGLKGPAAASLANQLTGQIGQLTSDVATIEQGGLTPTNESRAIAEKSMQDWWGKGTIHDMTAQGRYNMQVRHMARQSQEPMTPGNAPSLAPAAPATPFPAEGTTGTVGGKPAVWKTVNGVAGWYAK